MMTEKEHAHVTTKRSLYEHLNELDTAHHESHMANLAHAMRYAEAGIEAYRQAIVDLENLKLEITAAAQGDVTKLSLERVKDLYQRSQKSGARL